VISFDGMENAESEATTGLVCVKQNQDKPSCAEDTRTITGRISGWLPLPPDGAEQARLRRDAANEGIRLHRSSHMYLKNQTHVRLLKQPYKQYPYPLTDLSRNLTNSPTGVLSDWTERQSVYGHKSARNTPPRINLPDLGLPGTARVFRIFMRMSPRRDTRQQETRQP
jgi:hypothetical protein